jgi:methionyl-tRNA formyltransferase
VATLAGAEVRIVAGATKPSAALPGMPPMKSSTGHHVARTVDAATALPGTILAAGARSVDVATRDGVYSIHEVQPPGKRPMGAAAYLRGRRLSLPAAPVG